MAGTLANVVNVHEVRMLTMEIRLQANDGRDLTRRHANGPRSGCGNDLYRTKSAGGLIGCQPNFTKSALANRSDEVKSGDFGRHPSTAAQEWTCPVAHCSEHPSRDCMVCSSRVIIDRSTSLFGRIAAVSLTR